MRGNRWPPPRAPLPGSESRALPVRSAAAPPCPPRTPRAPQFGHRVAGELHRIAVADEPRDGQLLVIAPPGPRGGIRIGQEDVVEVQAHAFRKARQRFLQQELDIAARLELVARVDEENV